MNLNVCVLPQTSWGCVMLLHSVITTLSSHGECQCARGFPQGVGDDYPSSCCSAVPQSSPQRQCCLLLPQPLTKTATELNVGVWLGPWVTCILICAQSWSLLGRPFKNVQTNVIVLFILIFKGHSYIMPVILINRNSTKKKP